jgi:hypothetical protein
MTDTASKIEENQIVHRLLAEKARARLDLFFEDDAWTEREVRNVITYYYYSPVEKREAWQRAMKYIPTELGVNDPVFRDWFEDKTREQFGIKLGEMDDLSQLGPMDPYSQAQNQEDWFEWRSSKFYLAPFLASGGFGFVTGSPGTGKTNYTVLMMELALSLGIGVATNIKMKDAPEGVFMTRSFKELLKYSLDNLKKGKFTIAFLDEVAQFFSRKRAMSKGYVNMEKMLFLLRKVGCNLIAIVQRPEDVASVIVSFSTVHYQKTKKNAMTIKMDDKLYTIMGVPAAHLKYDTWDPASFVVDVDMEALHDHIASLPPDSDQFQAIADFLMEDESVEVTKSDKKIVAKVLYTSDWNPFTSRRWTLTEIGELLGVSKDTIRNWLIEIKVLDAS